MHLRLFELDKCLEVLEAYDDFEPEDLVDFAEKTVFADMESNLNIALGCTMTVFEGINDQLSGSCGYGLRGDGI